MTHGLHGIHRDEYGTYVWQPRDNGGFDIVRVSVCPGTIPERPSFRDEYYGGGYVGSANDDPPDGGDEIEGDAAPNVHYEGRPVSSLSLASSIIRQIRAKRDNPKKIDAEQLVPEHVRTYYSAYWAGEQNALELDEAARLAKEERRRRMWWWQRLLEAMWVKQ